MPSARRRLGGRVSQSLKSIGRRQNLLQRAGSEPLPPSLLSSFLNTSPHLGGSSPGPGPGPGPGHGHGHDSREHAAIRRELDVYRLTHNALKRVVEEAKALPPFPPPHLPPPLPPSGGGGGGGDDDDDDGAVEEERTAAAEAPRRLLREVTVVMNVTDEMLADIQGRFSSLGTTETVTRLTKLGSEPEEHEEDLERLREADRPFEARQRSAGLPRAVRHRQNVARQGFQRQHTAVQGGICPNPATEQRAVYTVYGVDVG